MDKYYEIKVIIRKLHPITCRRLRMPANITFNEQAAIIEISFEWCGYHLYEFEAGVALHERGVFIGIPAEDEYRIENIRGRTLDSGKEKVDKYFKKYKKKKFIYDFGDDQEHDIIIEKEINEKIDYPLCIKAKSGAYTEDCGGTYGYEEYYPNNEGRKILDIDFINDELEDYKNFAKQLYDREMF